MASKVSGVIEKINVSGTERAIASTAYGYCETAAGTAAKVVDMTDFKLYEGVTIHVKFKEKNSASNPTLNVQETGAKPIVQYGTTAASTTESTNGWYAGAVLTLTYDGTSWVRDQGFNTNTTYSAMSVAEARTGTATSSRLIRADYLKTFLSTLGGSGLDFVHTSEKIELNHSNSVTAKTAYVDTATTASANGGTIKVTDIKYDAQGHVTGSQDRTITLSQKTNFDDTYLKLNGSNNMTADVNIIAGDTDKFVNFWYNTNKTAGASWRAGMLGSGNGNTNYFVIQSGTSTTSATTWNNALKIGQNNYDIYNNENRIPNTGNATGSVGGTTTPVYVDAGVIKALSYTIAKSVPSDAKFTDTTSFTITASATDGLWDLTGTSGTNAVTYALAPYNSKGNTATFYTAATDPTLTTRLNYDGYFYATKLYSGGAEVLTSYTETDPTVPSWAKASTKPSYTANEVGALPSSTVVNKVKQSSNSSSAAYKVLFGTTASPTSGNDYETYYGSLTYNPNTKALVTGGTIDGYTLAAACAKAVTDSSSASAISTGTSLPTERDIYYGLPTINGIHNYNSSTNYYIPTAVGTAGQVLKSQGSGAPEWEQEYSVEILDIRP